MTVVSTCDHTIQFIELSAPDLVIIIITMYLVPVIVMLD